MALVLIASDNFNRTNGAVGSNWTDSPDEGFGLTISSNALLGQGGDAAGFWNASSFTNDQYAQATITTKNGGYSGPIVRASATDYVVGQYNSTLVFITWYNGGAYTRLNSTAYVIANGDVLRLEASGTTYSLYVNNVLKCTGTNASAPSTGAAGILCSSADVVDDWSGGNIITAAVPNTSALTITKYAPTVTATNNQNVVPGVASLSLSAFAPTAVIPGNQLVIPGQLALTSSTFAPTALVTDNKVSIPSVLALSLTSFAPNVSATQNQFAVPGTLASTLSAYAPTVSTSGNMVVVPSILSLSTSTLAPTVTATDTKIVVPAVLTLTLSSLTPTVSVTANQTVIPNTLSLSSSLNAPSAVIGIHIIPGVKALTISSLAPAVAISDNKTLVPMTIGLVLSSFVPTINTTAHIVSIPGTLTLIITPRMPVAANGRTPGDVSTPVAWAPADTDTVSVGAGEGSATTTWAPGDML